SERGAASVWRRSPTSSSEAATPPCSSARGVDRNSLKQRVGHPHAEELMDDVPAKQTVNGAVSIVRVRHRDQAGLPGDGAHDEAGKSRIAAAMHDIVTLFRVSYLPPERLRYRIVDLYLRVEHFLETILIEAKSIVRFRGDDFD